MVLIKLAIYSGMLYNYAMLSKKKKISIEVRLHDEPQSCVGTDGQLSPLLFGLVENDYYCSAVRKRP